MAPGKFEVSIVNELEAKWEARFRKLDARLEEFEKLKIPKEVGEPNPVYAITCFTCRGSREHFDFMFVYDTSTPRVDGDVERVDVVGSGYQRGTREAGGWNERGPREAGGWNEQGRCEARGWNGRGRQ